MSALHTPGPLEVCGNLVRTARDADGGGGFLVAEFPLTSPHRIGDANLFAAAPDLWEALVRLLRHCPTYSEFDDSDDHLYGAALERARAAIVKATGEQA